MINNYQPTAHKGFMPVRVLEQNIIKWFETIHPDFVEECKKVIKDKQLSQGISYEINEFAIYYDKYYVNLDYFGIASQTPYVAVTDDMKKQIVLHETFMSYLWCMSYSIWVIFEQGIHIPLNKKEYNGIINHENIVVKKAFEVFIYGLSLIKTYSKWDYTLPNPEYYLESDEEIIIKSNGVFLGATNFILAHEYSHVKEGHLDKLILETKKGIKVSNADILKMEFEADLKAWEICSKKITDETTKVNIGIGLVIATCSLLYLNKKINSSDHPDTDERVKEILEKLNFDDEHSIWGIACLAFQLFGEQNGFTYNFPMQENYKVLFYEYLKKFEDLKK